MKKALGILCGICVLLTFSYGQMKCAPGKCGGGKCGGAEETTQPAKMAQPFQSVSSSEATLLQKGDAKAFCPNCGMGLVMFYKTNHAATVGGKVKQYCSIHCLAEDIKKGLKPEDIMVVDLESLKFVEAEKAYYVVGSSKPATMSMTSQYAFARKAAAEMFTKENSGKIMDFHSALKKASEDFFEDAQMIEKKQTKMRMEGERLYAQKCQKTKLSFSSAADAKAFILSNSLCDGLEPKQLQAVGLYLESR